MHACVSSRFYAQQLEEEIHTFTYIYMMGTDCDPWYSTMGGICFAAADLLIY